MDDTKAQNDTYPSFLKQVADGALTRTQFRQAFEQVKAQLRVAIANLHAHIDKRMDEIRDQKPPTREQLLELIRPLIPQVKDGETPSDDHIRTLILQLMPPPTNGEDGVPGKDADEEAIRRRILADLPTMGKQLRLALQGEHRLTAAEIDGIEEMFAGVLDTHTKKILGSLGPGGGTSFALMQSGTVKAQQPIALNFTGAGAPTITHGSNGTTNLSFGSSAVGFQAPTGTVDGSNTVFVFATEPNVICVDDGRPMRKTASDGTANWTGTTTVTLAIAPNFDIFGIA